MRDDSAIRGSRTVNWKGSEWAAKGEPITENSPVMGITADGDCTEIFCNCSPPDGEFVISNGAVADKPESHWSDSDEEDEDCGPILSKHWTSFFCRSGGSTSHSPMETAVPFSQSVSLSLSVTFLYTISGSGTRRGGTCRMGRGSRPRHLGLISGRG